MDMTIIKLYDRKILDRKILSQTGIINFEEGMTIDVEYENPKKGRMVIWIEDDAEHVLLTFSARVQENPELVLNYKLDEWGPSLTIGGYDFTPGAPQYASFQAQKDHFIVRVNGKDLYHFKYPPKMRIDEIHKVIVQYDGDLPVPKFKGVSYKTSYYGPNA